MRSIDNRNQSIQPKRWVISGSSGLAFNSRQSGPTEHASGCSKTDIGSNRFIGGQGGLNCAPPITRSQNGTVAKTLALTATSSNSRQNTRFGRRRSGPRLRTTSLRTVNELKRVGGGIRLWHHFASAPRSLPASCRLQSTRVHVAASAPSPSGDKNGASASRSAGKRPLTTLHTTSSRTSA